MSTPDPYGGGGSYPSGESDPLGLKAVTSGSTPSQRGVPPVPAKTRTGPQIAVEWTFALTFAALAALGCTWLWLLVF